MTHSSTRPDRASWYLRFRQLSNWWTKDPNDSPSFLAVVVEVALVRPVAALEASTRQRSHPDIKPNNVFVAFDQKGGVCEMSLIHLDSVLSASEQVGGTWAVRSEPLVFGTAGYLRSEKLDGGHAARQDGSGAG